MADTVTLADAIKQLRAQLEDAQREGTGKNLRFLAKSVEVELAIVFKSETGKGGGTWFLDTSGDRAADKATHRVKLVLEPAGRDGMPTLVSDMEHESDSEIVAHDDYRPP